MTRSEIGKIGRSDTVDEHGYPFQADWERRQQEPLPDFGVSIFDNSTYSLFAKNRLPERTIKKEFQSQQRMLTGLKQD